MTANLRDAIALHLEGGDLAALGFAAEATIIVTLEPGAGRRPRLRGPSGSELLRIFRGFRFSVHSQGGSHIKLRRTHADGTTQTLTMPAHHEVKLGDRAIFALRHP